MRRSLCGMVSVAALAACCAFGPAEAGSNPSIQLLQHTPLTLFSYGLDQLGQGLRGSFTAVNPPPFALFSGPMSGKIADIATVIYDPAANTITLNLVKIDRLPDGATPDDACGQAMQALRMFAGLDPASGQLQPGMDSSLIAGPFAAAGSSVDNPPADYLATLDKSFVLRFSGLADKRFICHAPLFGTGYTLDK